MTTIVVLKPVDHATLVLFSEDHTTVLLPSQVPQDIVLTKAPQVVIFNSEGPPGPTSDFSDPGDLAAAYQSAKV